METSNNILHVNDLIEKNKIDLLSFDKKVIIKEQVEKGKKKTIIFGLSSINGFENSKKAHEDFSKKIKVKLGCGCHVSENQEENNITYSIIFQGIQKSL